MSDRDTSTDRHEDLLHRSWADDWERLPPASNRFERGPQTDQVTVRIASGAVEAVKKLAQRRALPYHALVRSWVVTALHDPRLPEVRIQHADERAHADRQLNIKLSPDILARLKRTAHEMSQPYHRLVRLWLYEALMRDTADVPNASPGPGISLTEVLLLLLHARGPQGKQDEPLRGDTRLVKLLFVASKRLGQGPGELFYAYNYGPFSDDVYDARDALRAQGMLGETDADPTEMPTFQAMMNVVRSKGRSQTSLPFYQLNERGASAARRLVANHPASRDALYVIESVKREYGQLSDQGLVDRVYAEYPEYTDKSLIVDEVQERSQRRHNK